MFKTLFLALTILLIQTQSFSVNKIFTNNMVIQRDVVTHIWGKSTQKIIKVSFGSHILTENVVNGNFKVALPAMPAGGPFEIKVEELPQTGQELIIKNVMFGEVFLCSGQSNMQWSVAASWEPQPDIIDSDNYPNIRFFTIVPDFQVEPLEEFRQSKGWDVSNRAVTGGFSSVCFYFGRALHKRLKIPIGLLHSSLGGSAIESWMPKEIIPNCPGSNNGRFSQLYNGMINPIVNLKIKGMLWYQGESNAGAWQRYGCQLTEMIKDWRTRFGSEFYFLNVLLAGFENGDFRQIRLVQHQLKDTIKSYGTANTIDLGEMTDIHPRRKREVGERLEFIAANQMYGFNTVDFQGPLLDNNIIHHREGEIFTSTLAFKNHGGLELQASTFCTSCCSNTNNIFEVIDRSGKTYPTQIQIHGDLVRLTSRVPVAAEITTIVYAWHKYSQCVLASKDKLASFPFYKKIKE